MSKFVNYNSAEKEVLIELFNKMPMMDTYVANIVEEYIYSTVREYYPDGPLKTEYRTKYGVQDGEYKFFHDNGKLWVESNYKDGKLDGKFIQYRRSGNKETECYYKDGKVNGLYTEYSSGMKTLECTYKDDKKDGLEIAWYPGGVNKRYEVLYKEGNMVGKIKKWNHVGLYKVGIKMEVNN